jgi:hypothetical protein
MAGDMKELIEDRPGAIVRTSKDVLYTRSAEDRVLAV